MAKACRKNPHAGFGGGRCINRGLWQPMDTLRERHQFEELWNSGKAPQTGSVIRLRLSPHRLITAAQGNLVVHGDEAVAIADVHQRRHAAGAEDFVMTAANLDGFRAAII